MSDKKTAGPVTVATLRRMKRRGQRIVMLTAYDAAFARLLDETNAVDVLLVGDSLGMVVQGEQTTLTVTVEDVLYHCRAVARASRRAQIVADMPFMSYQASIDEGMRNAGRLLKQGGAHAVKLEGGRRCVDLVARLVSAGIPVMGHLGLTPQSVHALGGYKVQGKDQAAAQALLEEAEMLQAAGAYAIVLEGVPQALARTISERLEIPTIGIGAGPACDGQVLVIYDLLGMDERFCPRFVKRYEDFSSRIRCAVQAFAKDVHGGVFPAAEHSFDGPSGLETESDRGGMRAIPIRRAK